VTRGSCTAAVIALWLIGCEGDAEKALTRAELLDPENCESCHPNHYREWASSMHAYAADDPVFLAMNRRGQEETDGGLGDFCVNCHAPMAVREDAITDFAELEDIPPHLKGITCYFCHNAVSLEGDHNNMVQLADDTVMRGGFGRGVDGDPLPVQPSAHRAEYSPIHDSYDARSSTLCGGCHDIVTPAPHSVPLERTFREFKNSLISQGTGFFTCQNCHMEIYTGPAAEDPTRDVLSRTLHEHLWPGVDVALSPFPDRELQQAAVECALSLSATIDIRRGDLPGEFKVLLETFAGHNQPSGAAQDRRMWLELVAYDAECNVIYESATIADDEPELKAGGEFGPREDREPWILRDRIFDKDGDEVHMFWEAARFESNTLPPRTAESLDHTVPRSYTLPEEPARIVARLRMRPMGFDVLQDLVDSGHLDPSVIEEMPTFTVFTGEWTTTAEEPEGVFTPGPQPSDCRYTCMLEHRAADCRDSEETTDDASSGSICEN
jgi:hypothetical protein